MAYLVYFGWKKGTHLPWDSKTDASKKWGLPIRVSSLKQARSKCKELKRDKRIGWCKSTKI